MSERKSIAEIMEEASARDAKLAEQVFVEGDLIVVNIQYRYEVPLSGCKSHEAVLNWCFHLSDKTWMTLDALMRFAYLACKENGLEIRA